MTPSDTVRVRGTSDPVEIAAVLAAVLSAASGDRSGRLSSYEQWRRTRVAALRGSLNGR